MSSHQAFRCSAALWPTGLALCLLAWLPAPPAHAQGEQFTLRVGAVPVPLASHTTLWNYRKGTNAPQADWTFAEDGDLDSTFLSKGLGGFGFGDNDDATVLSDMQNRYLSVFIRQTFQAPASVNPAHHLRLAMDWDDGFVAYLDGVEVARSNNSGPAGTPHPWNQGTTSEHSASSEGGAVARIDLGPAGGRLAPGPHVLAIQGINRDLANNDLSLIADLTLEDPSAGTATVNPLFALATTPVLKLSGLNTYLEAEDVLVNGEAAAYDGLAGTWSKSQDLAPGMNRLLIVTRDAQGRVLASISQDVIYEVSTTSVGGTLPATTTWGPSMGVIRATSNITIPAGASLKVDPGAVVLLSPNVTVIAQAGASIQIEGSESAKVFFLPADGATGWGELTAQGAGSRVTVRHADVAGGRIRALSGAVGLIEDSHVHHSSASSIINSLDAQSFTVRRSHVEWYQEMLYQRTLMLIEDSLFENPASDAVDFDGAPMGSVIRQCTFRHGPTGSNTDAVDLGPLSGAAVGVTVEDCVMHDFSDKGVSIGEIGTANSASIVIRNCLIFDVVRGVQVKDTTVATIHDCTIVDCQIGMHGFHKQPANPGGGIITNFNNILYGDFSAIVTNAPPDPTIITVTYSDTFGVNWPGAGNINAEPLFRNPAERDYRLLPGSPCLGAGRDGEDMGVRYPVGGMPDLPGNLRATPGAAPGEARLTWVDSDAKESGFIIQMSTDEATWTDVATAPKNATSASVPGLAPGVRCFFRVQAVNFITRSLGSNVAELTSDPGDSDGDGMRNDWELAHGLNPNDPSDAAGDLDNDGLSNKDEYLAGTDPEDPASLLVIDSIALLAGEGKVRLVFKALANRTYQVQATADLNTGPWETNRTVDAQPQDRTMEIDDLLPAGAGKRFYRLSTP